MSDYLARAEAIKEKLIAIRRNLHMHPELSFQEIRTGQLVAKTLDELGIHYTTGVAKTGIVGQIGTGSPVIALRADMDALPIVETNEVSYKSLNQGVMHACGHDAHTTALLGAAMLLSEDFRAGSLKGTVRLLFQPAEETFDEEGKSGGQRMVEEGVLEGVDGVFGLHVYSRLPSNEIHICEGPLFAAVDTFYGTIIGRGGHSGLPHITLDPIWLSGQVINAVNGIVSRLMNPIENGVISITQIHAGTATNVIPAEVQLSGTIRSFKSDVREQLLRDLERAFSIVRAWGGDYVLKIQQGYPVTVNDPGMTQFVRDAAVQLWGPTRIKKATPVMASEDFAYMAQNKPSVFIILGAEKDSIDRQHHASNFDIDEAVLSTGAALHAQMAYKFLNEFR